MVSKKVEVFCVFHYVYLSKVGGFAYACFKSWEVWTFLQWNVNFLDFWTHPWWQRITQEQVRLGSVECWVLSTRQPVSTGQWLGFHLHLWPWKGEGHTAGTLHLRFLEELKKNGLGVLGSRNLTLWDKNKLAGDVCNSNSNPCKEGRGHWKRGVCQVKGDPLQAFVSLHWKGCSWHTSQVPSWFVLGSFCYVVVIMLYKRKKTRSTFKEC